MTIASMPKRNSLARIRRVRGSAILSPDDVAFYSDLLNQEFPQLIYFFANYKTGVPTPEKFAEDVPVVLYETLKGAVNAALTLEKQRPDWNRPDVMVRWPWPEDAFSGDVERLIGGRRFPDPTEDRAGEYRELGRWFLFQYRGKGYLHPRKSTDPRVAPVCDEVQREGVEYSGYLILDATQSEFFSLYDLSDVETKSFAQRAFILWRRISTKHVGHYDPSTHEFFDPPGWDGKYPWYVGKRALLGGLEKPPRYAGFAPKSAEDGSPLMLGPRPVTRKRRA
jgi:hypothetical protein